MWASPNHENFGTWVAFLKAGEDNVCCLQTNLSDCLTSFARRLEENPWQRFFSFWPWSAS